MALLLPVLLLAKEDSLKVRGCQDAQNKHETHARMTCCEKIAFGFGVIFALVQGVSAPAIALFMGESITTLAVADHSRELDAMSPEFMKAPKSLKPKTKTANLSTSPS